MRRGDRGAALIVAMVMVLIVTGLVTALLNAAAMRSKGTNDRLEAYRTFQAAQAAVERAISRIRTLGPEEASFGERFISDRRLGGLAFVTDGSNGDAAGEIAEFDGAEYFAVVGDLGDGRYAVVGAARLGDSERVIEAIVRAEQRTLPGPFPPSGAESGGAITIVGPVGKKAKLKLPGHLMDPADIDPLDPDDNNDTSKDHLVTISGIDKSAQGKNTLGLGVSDLESYKKLVESITKKMAEGKIPEGVFDGAPLNTFNVKDTDVTTGIGESKGTMDGDMIADYADAVAETVRNELIPQAKLDGNYIDDVTFMKTEGVVDTDIVLGGPGEVTVIDAKKLKIHHPRHNKGASASISGEGTLVLMGELDIHHADFDWDGDIILLGDTKDAKLHNHHGTLNVNGTIVALGSGKKGKASIHIHNDSGTDDSSSTINGGVLLMSGREDKKAKVEFKAKHGSLEMRGLLMMLGHQIKVDLHPEHGKEHGKHKGRRGQFSMEGNMILGLSESTDPKKAKKNKLDMKIKGDVSIQHDSDAVDEALALFEKFFDKLAPDVQPSAAPDSYEVVVWREK